MIADTMRQRHCERFSALAILAIFHNFFITYLLLGFWKKDTSLHVVDLVDEASGGELVQKEEVARVAVHNQDGKNIPILPGGKGLAWHEKSHLTETLQKHSTNLNLSTCPVSCLLSLMSIFLFSLVGPGRFRL